mgnify:CR=1 FL=1
MDQMEKNPVISSFWKWVLGLTTVIEGGTFLFRFGFNLESTRDTASWVAPLTFGVRIHHGYIGLLICLAILFKVITKRFRWLAGVIGLSLVFSDVIHHFAVLWWVTGSPQFDLLYPR